MTDVLKQKIMLIFIFFVLLIAIIGFLLLNRSLAWFSLNNQISAGGMKVEVLYSDICESINYYRGTEMQLEGEGDDLYNRYYFSYDPAALDFKKLDTDTAPERDAFTTPIQMLEYSDLTGSCQILIELKMIISMTKWVTEMHTICIWMSKCVNTAYFFGFCRSC